jgi:hypothetical protein
LYVGTFTATQAPAAATPIAAASFTSLIVVGEDASVANWPTTAYSVWKVNAAGATVGPRRVAIGREYAFEARGAPFAQGQVVGYIQPITTSTFFQDEHAVGRPVGYAQ